MIAAVAPAEDLAALDREVVVDEKDADLAVFLLGTAFDSQQFVDHAFIGAEAD